MSGKRPRAVYWDAGIFLSYVNGEADRLPDIEAILTEADAGETEIYTSRLSVAEVAFAGSEQAGRALDPAVEQALDELWLPPSPIKLIDVHALNVEEARRLMRWAITQGYNLKPADAIHLGTARRLVLAGAITKVHCYDGGWDKYAAQIGCAISRPRPETFSFPPTGTTGP